MMKKYFKNAGDMWDSGGVKMDVKTCLWNGGLLWKINIDLKWVEKCTQIPSRVVVGAVVIAWVRYQLADVISELKSRRGVWLWHWIDDSLDMILWIENQANSPKKIYAV